MSKLVEINEAVSPLYHNNHLLENGLTKREHFAGMALAGMISHANAKWEIETLAEDAVKFADALISELGKESA